MQIWNRRGLNRLGAIGAALIIAVFALGLGCGRQSGSSGRSVGASPSADSAGGPTASDSGAAPGHMDIGTGAALTPTPQFDSQISQLGKAGGSKKQLSQVYTKRGMERMMDQQASPHLKYPAALDDFRHAAALDPQNKVAANNMKLIESIYQSMGRPIPSD